MQVLALVGIWKTCTFDIYFLENMHLCNIENASCKKMQVIPH